MLQSIYRRVRSLQAFLPEAVHPDSRKKAADLSIDEASSGDGKKAESRTTSHLCPCREASVRRAARIVPVRQWEPRLRGSDEGEHLLKEQERRKTLVDFPCRHRSLSAVCVIT